MPSIVELPDDGLITFQFRGVDIQCDLYQLNDQLLEISNEYQTKSSVDYMSAIRELLIRYGFPPDVTHRTCLLVQNAVIARVDELKKNDGDSGSPASPGSTGSTPLPSDTTN